MNKQESAGVRRVRPSGHSVVGGLEGVEIIDAMRDIVKRRAYSNINGVTVDTFSASAVIAIYDNVNEVNKQKLLVMSVVRLIAVCFATLDRVRHRS